jgi:hypothetical protein
VEGSCEHGNEPYGSINTLGNSIAVDKLAVSQEGLRVMKLVIAIYSGM